MIPLKQLMEDDILGNSQVNLSEIPSISTLEYQGMEKNMLKANITWSILFFGISIIVFILLSFVFKVSFFINNGLGFIIGSAIIGLLAIAHTYFAFFKKSYALRTKDIVYNSGLFWKKTITIPFNRVQHCEVSQGPIDRYFNLSELKIFTAGGSSSDLTIEGLNPETSARIKDFIVSKTAMDEEE